MTIGFKEFSRINKRRSEAKNGFNHKLNKWNTSDWFLALTGELGEAANVAKKLNRYRDSIVGNTLPKYILKKRLRAELGDTFIYLDLLCQAEGFYLIDAVIETFDEKSMQIGYPFRIGNSK